MTKTKSKSPDVEMDTANKDNEVPRGNWGRQIEFFLSCVSYAVGMGNIWRFPYLCMRNGGGAFLIPYFMFLFLVGMPLFYLELSLGQFSSLSVMSVWKISPIFKGVGIASIMITFVVSIYYNVIIGWIVYYLFNSFTSTLPWGTCNNPWNTERCFARMSTSVEYINGSVSNSTFPPLYELDANVTQNISLKRNSPAEEFWHYNVLEISSGIDDLGGVQWKLMGTILFGWVIVFMCLIKGVKTSGKVVYVTATLPYFFLTILLIRGVMLPGSADGIRFFVVPDWKRLTDFTVWIEACLQIFYSVGPGWGCLITMASYNRFHNRLHIDALLVPVINCGTSFFAGCVVFSVVGFMAHEAGLSVEEVLTSGPGLAFIAYPEALTKLPIAPLWSILFFLMLLNIALGTQFVNVETLSSGLIDRFPSLLRIFKRRYFVTGILFFVMFILNMPFVTRAGIYYFQVVDWYSAAISLPVIAILECVIATIVYGISRFSYDIEIMIGCQPNKIVKILWIFVTPVLVAIVFIVSLSDFPRPNYGDYSYPAWAIAFGWVLASLSLLIMPVYAVYRIVQSKGPLLERLQDLSKPAADWGPALAQDRKDYKYTKCPKLPETIEEKCSLETVSFM